MTVPIKVRANTTYKIVDTYAYEVFLIESVNEQPAYRQFAIASGATLRKIFENSSTPDSIIAIQYV